VGVAYFGELDTDMTSRGFGTEAAKTLMGSGPASKATGVAPLELGVRALERGIAKRKRYIVAPAWVAGVLPLRMAAQAVVEQATQRGLTKALAIAREEQVELTTPQPTRTGR